MYCIYVVWEGSTRLVKRVETGVHMLMPRFQAESTIERLDLQLVSS
jgi:hypothetical protein